MACFESETGEKIELPPAVAKAFMNAVLDEMRGGDWRTADLMKPLDAPTGPPKSYEESLKAVSERSGLQANTLNSILRRDPQVFSRTKQALAKASDVRMIRDAADAFAGELKSNARMYEPGNAEKAWDSLRKAALYGHSVVFPWTHMRNWAVQIPTEGGRARMDAFWRAATDVYRYRGEAGKALYEMDVGLMKMSDHYDFAKASGLDVVPGVRDPGDILLQNKKPTWGQRNFDTLKMARYNAFEDIWSRADPALKEGDTGKAFASIVARDLNYATGSVMRPVGEAATSATARSVAELSNLAGKSNALLSSKLFFAKHMDATFSPLRYLVKAGRMTEAERAASAVALKRWSNTVATHLSILGANYAFNKAMGWETPNLTDMTKPDFLRMKIGGVVVPFSPMLEALRLPIVVTASTVAGQQGDAGKRIWAAFMGAAHPALRTAIEQASGKDYMGRPITWSLRHALATAFPSTAPKFTQSKAGEPVGGIEYLTTKAPIALAGAAHEFYQSLRNEGVGASMAMAFVKSAIAAAASAVVGTHAYEPTPKPEPVHHYRTMADKIRAEKSARTRATKQQQQQPGGWPQ